ncbi:MAG TPA: septal ring lytic transglycosylase RlpA family protein [Propylenella sp.]|nr:septal ring lytic transglycosylase RlpA family protein [Propylenella sp.]
MPAIAANPTVVAMADPVPAADPFPAGGSVSRPAGRYQVGIPYKIAGKWYKPSKDPNYDRVGVASWYGDAFHGRTTANGEIFDSAGLTAAHATLPLPSYVRVTNLDNDSSIIVRVNDRGPYAHTRLIDVSERTAEILGFKRDGVAPVRVEYIKPAPVEGEQMEFLLASYRGPDGASRNPNFLLAVTGRRPTPTRDPNSTRTEPVALASLAGQPPAPAAAAQPAVAFAAAGDAFTGPDALDAVETVSSTYEADARIAMAFEIAAAVD